MDLFDDISDSEFMDMCYIETPSTKSINNNIEEIVDFLSDTDLLDALDNFDELTREESAPNKPKLNYHKPIYVQVMQQPPNSSITNPPIETEQIEYDPNSITNWIYPTNYSVREYQYNIVTSCLFYNTLVSLPTGLGKTFIAAVVMLNYYRWFPNYKIVFMAPTKPLVTQQIEACHSICGISQDEMVILTGVTKRAMRTDVWADKRIFFITPQILHNDLVSGFLMAEKVSLVIVDEAHRATGNYSFVSAIKSLSRYNSQFRILALTATPGSNLDAVNSVLVNLRITKIEIRDEQSEDVKPYMFDKDIQKIVVEPTNLINEVDMKYQEIMKEYLDRLNTKSACFINDVNRCNITTLMQARTDFRTRCNNKRQSAVAEGDFAVMISMCHARKTLITQGVNQFLSTVKRYISQNNQNYSADSNQKQLIQNPKFITLMGYLETQIGLEGFVSHPKVIKLVQYLNSYFDSFIKRNNHEGLNNTRVMIFANLRETVDDLVTVIKEKCPHSKPSAFVGQAAHTSGKGMGQKQQNKVVDDFRLGFFNTLISTSIGEEGLDLGEVDLIICYDSHASPIKMLQRIGRTGRKRNGTICMLVTKGSEETRFGSAKYTHKKIQKLISSSADHNLLNFYAFNPRMIPANIYPFCNQMEIVSQNPFDHEVGERKRKKGGIGLSNVESREVGRILDLAIEYKVSSSWNSELQESVLFDHSRKTKMFVNNLKQIDNIRLDNDSLDYIIEARVVKSTPSRDLVSRRPTLKLPITPIIFDDDDNFMNLASLSKNSKLFLDKTFSPIKTPTKHKSQAPIKHPPANIINQHNNFFSDDMFDDFDDAFLNSLCNPMEIDNELIFIDSTITESIIENKQEDKSTENTAIDIDQSWYFGSILTSQDLNDFINPPSIPINNKMVIKRTGLIPEVYIGTPIKICNKDNRRIIYSPSSQLQLPIKRLAEIQHPSSDSSVYITPIKHKTIKYTKPSRLKLTPITKSRRRNEIHRKFFDLEAGVDGNDSDEVLDSQSLEDDSFIDLDATQDNAVCPSDMLAVYRRSLFMNSQTS